MENKVESPKPIEQETSQIQTEILRSPFTKETEIKRRDVDSYLEKIEKDPSQTSDDNGQPLMTPIADASEVVELPVNRETFARGLTQAITEVGRWLSEFVFRLIKKSDTHHKKVKFKS